MEERLLDILKHFKLSPSTFAEKLGIQRSSVSHLLSGRNKPSFDFLSRLMDEIPELNIDWVISGKGNMLKNKVVSQTSRTLFDTDHIPIQPETSSNKKELISKKGKEEFTNVNNLDISSTK